VNVVKDTSIALSSVDEQTIESLRRIADDAAVLIVEHRHHFGARSPTRLVFSDGDALVQYLASSLRPGDAIWVWNYDNLCRDDNALFVGKSPLADGHTPRGGAY